MMGDQTILHRASGIVRNPLPFRKDLCRVVCDVLQAPGFGETPTVTYMSWVNTKKASAVGLRESDLIQDERGPVHRLRVLHIP